MMKERFELNEEMMDAVVGGDGFEEFVDKVEKGWDKLWSDILRIGEND